MKGEKVDLGVPVRGPSYCALISSQGELKHTMKLLGYSKQETREYFPDFFTVEELYGIPETKVAKV